MELENNLLKYVPIDYAIINLAASFYMYKGYTCIEVPWIISEEASKVTCFNDERAFFTNNNSRLIGSAEQGFIQLMLDGQKLKNDTLYFAISPCFRNEIEDMTHSKTFMKLELFYKSDNIDLQNKICRKMIQDAKEFFSIKLIETEEIITVDGTDLEYNGLELGSYGIRTYKNLSWVYGTGVALPRITIAKGLHTNE